MSTGAFKTCIPFGKRPVIFLQMISKASTIWLINWPLLSTLIMNDMMSFGEAQLMVEELKMFLEVDSLDGIKKFTNKILTY